MPTGSLHLPTAKICHSTPISKCWNILIWDSSTSLRRARESKQNKNPEAHSKIGSILELRPAASSCAKIRPDQRRGALAGATEVISISINPSKVRSVPLCWRGLYQGVLELQISLRLLPAKVETRCSQKKLKPTIDHQPIIEGTVSISLGKNSPWS